MCFIVCKAYGRGFNTGVIVWERLWSYLTHQMNSSHKWRGWMIALQTVQIKSRHAVTKTEFMQGWDTHTHTKGGCNSAVREGTRHHKMDRCGFKSTQQLECFQETHNQDGLRNHVAVCQINRECTEVQEIKQVSFHPNCLTVLYLPLQFRINHTLPFTDKGEYCKNYQPM